MDVLFDLWCAAVVLGLFGIAGWLYLDNNALEAWLKEMAKDDEYVERQARKRKGGG